MRMVRTVILRIFIVLVSRSLREVTSKFPVDDFQKFNFWNIAPQVQGAIVHTKIYRVILVNR